MKYHIVTIVMTIALIVYLAVIAPAQLEARGKGALDMVATSAVTLLLLIVVAFLVGETLKRESEDE